MKLSGYLDSFCKKWALENAAGIAAMVVITGSLVSDTPEKEKMPGMPTGGGMEGVY